MTKRLPEPAQRIIHAYQNLPLGKEGVICPYFINHTNNRGGLTVMVGKGSPSEIVEETVLIAQKKRFDLDTKTPTEVRAFMKKNYLGIDCSGFVSHILASTNPDILKKLARVNPLTHPFRFFWHNLNPVKNISVKVLTNTKNAERVESINNIEPGDMIRTRNGKHVLLVTEVKFSEGVVTDISYVHTTSFYGDANGIRTGSISVTDSSQPLEKQIWDEVDETGENYTLKGYVEGGKDSGIFRLKEFN